MGIRDCGEIGAGQELGVNCADGTPDQYPHHPEDLELDWYGNHSLYTLTSDQIIYPLLFKMTLRLNI